MNPNTKKTATLSILGMLALGGAALAARQAGMPRPGGPALGDDGGEIHTLHRQIAAKLLFDGLKLTPEQRTQLSAKLAELQGRRDAKREQLEPNRDELVAALTAARDEVYRTGAVSDATRQRIQKLREDARAGRAGRAGAAGDAGDGAARPGIKQEIEKILTPEQASYIKEFRPMKQLGFGAGKDDGAEPGHRGEIGGGIAARVRQMSDEDYARKKAQLLDRARAGLEREGVTGDAASQRLETIGKQLDTIRTGTPEQIADLKQDFALPLLLAGAGHGRDMARGPMMTVRILMSPEFRALLDGKDPLAAR